MTKRTGLFAHAGRCPKILWAALAIWPLLASCVAGMPAADATPPGPAVYAWAAFDRSGVTDSGASGLADRAQGRAMRVTDPVRIASVSKLVVALAVMRLVEEGTLALDDDVSETLGWQLRHPSYPAQPLTLRMLLSHTSGLRDDGESYIIAPESSLQQAATSAAMYDPAHPPGTHFQYANVNYVVIGSVLEAATGERFDRLMQRIVLQPLGIGGCFGWTTCSTAQIEQGVTLYAADGSIRKDGVENRRADCPVAEEGPACNLSAYAAGTNGALFSPQGGLRISVADLTRIGLLFLNDGKHDGKAFLSERSLEQLIGPEWVFDGTNGATSGGFFCSFGLGVQTLAAKTDACGDTLFADGRSAFGHAGEAYGLLSGLWIDPVSGKGIAYFSANDYGQANDGSALFRPIERELANRIAR